MRHEREYLTRALEVANGERQMAARVLGISRKTPLEEAQGVRHQRLGAARRAMTSVPVHLQGRLGAFVAEEVISSIRHSVVNDLTALAALCYRLKIEHIIQMNDEAAARAAQDLLDNIQAYVKAASRRLEITFVPAAPPTPRSLDVGTVLKGLVARLAGARPASSSRAPRRAAAAAHRRGRARARARVPAHQRLRRARARSGRVRLRCAEGPAETIRIDVEHDGAPLGVEGPLSRVRAVLLDEARAPWPRPQHRAAHRGALGRHRRAAAGALAGRRHDAVPASVAPPHRRGLIAAPAP